MWPAGRTLPAGWTLPRPVLKGVLTLLPHGPSDVYAVCFTYFDKGGVIIIFKSILTTFIASELKIDLSLKSTTVIKFSLAKLMKHTVKANRHNIFFKQKWPSFSEI
jgi:hypothetical protein